MSHPSPLWPLLCLVWCSSAVAQSEAARALHAVRAELEAHGFAANDLADAVVKDHYSGNGITHAIIRQRWQGVEVWNGDIGIHQRADGGVVQVNIGAFRHVEKRLRTDTPVITAGQALALVLPRTAPGVPLPEPIDVEDGGRRVVFDGTFFSNTPVVVQQYFLPVNDSLRLVWNVNHYLPDGSHWWNVRVDAVTGEELERNDWVVNCGPGHTHGPACDAPMEDDAMMLMAPNDYRVFPWPIESPSHGARAVRTAPWLDGGIASPYGWHDTNGAAGAEQTDTRGNNVRAQEDRNADNAGGYRPSGGATLQFDFPLNLANAPNTYQDPAITNLFYWNNIIHDVWYQYGFDEPSGNFQQNNYGRGGTGNDHVIADAQDGSGTDNANFATPPDGTPPRMQMFEWTYTTPRRDSDLDNGVIAHEYGHGISNRLVGGPANTNCLANAEQMGEGWSDFIALVMTIKAGDTGPMPRGIGTYVTGQPPTGGGIRPAPYSTDFTVNGYTYAATNNTATISQPHGIGFVWCTILWEMTWELIGIHGLDPDIYNGTGGNNIAMRLVIEAMKLTPCNPGFVQARNAILQADQNLYGGTNQNALWVSFARRGLGSSADQGNSNSRTDQTQAFDTPMATNVGVVTVTSPTPASYPDCNGQTVNISALVRNFGSQPQSNIPIRYRLNAGAWVNGTVPGILGAGASVSYTFSTPLTMPGTGPHIITVATDLAGDMYAGDNTASSAITIVTPVTLVPPFSEGLPVPGATPPGWTIQNPDNGITWTSGMIDIGTTCATQRVWYKDNYNDAAVGEEDRLLTPLVDLAYMTDIYLEFDHAYARYNATYSDAFRVDISNDCGTTWTTIFDQANAALATAPNNTNFYVPAACAQWRHTGVNITAYAGQTVMFRFVTINGYGNTFLMDNVAVNGNSTLPVELVRLSANTVPQGIQVHWTTANETNSSRYEVERSTDLATWDLIGTVRAAGNSSVTIGYDLLDPTPRPGTNYYRLHMVDLDGSSERSEVVFADRPREELHPHPNPNNGSFTMLPVDPGESMEVIDATGRQVAFHATPMADGRVQVDLLAPTSGVYLIRMSGMQERIVVTAD